MQYFKNNATVPQSQAQRLAGVRQDPDRDLVLTSVMDLLVLDP